MIKLTVNTLEAKLLDCAGILRGTLKENYIPKIPNIKLFMLGVFGIYNINKKLEILHNCKV